MSSWTEYGHLRSMSLLDMGSLVDPETPTSTAACSETRPNTPESLMSFLGSMGSHSTKCAPTASPFGCAAPASSLDVDVHTLQLLIDSLTVSNKQPCAVSDDAPPGLAAAASTGSGGGGGGQVLQLKTSDTTMMLRNVPYEAQQTGVLRVLDESPFRGRYSFFYCPLDFRSLNNLGYAFVNLDSPETGVDFVAYFDGLKVSGWDKPLRVSRARIQGYAPNVEHYRNSPVNLKSDEFKPMIFALKPHHHKLPFPAPSDVSPPASATASAASGAASASGKTGAGGSLRPRERRLHAKSQSGGSSCPGTASTHNMRVFVGGLGVETDSMSLWEYMTQFGRVMDAQVLIDPTTGKSRNYGFCTFADGTAAAKALEKSQHTLDGREIVVRKYTSNK